MLVGKRLDLLQILLLFLKELLCFELFNSNWKSGSVRLRPLALITSWLGLVNTYPEALVMGWMDCSFVHDGEGARSRLVALSKW